MNNDKTVSVIITCYNYAEYVEEAIRSVLEQTYSNIEIIIINDGSTDNSDDVITGLISSHSQIAYINQKNKGVVYTRNFGLDKATGAYLMFLDADDKIPADYIASNVEMIESHKLDVVYTDFEYFGSREGIDRFPDYKLEYMKHMNIVHISSLMRASCVGEHRFDEQLANRSHEDWDFFLGLALKGVKIGKNPSTRLYYRQHKTSRNNLEESDRDRFEYAEVYRDVLHKYSLQYHDELFYLASTRFANYLSVVYRKTIPELQSLIEERDSEILNLKLQQHTVLTSATYRAGRALVFIPRMIIDTFKKIFKIN